MKTLLAALIIVALLAAAPLPSRAGDDPLFLVRGVKVDVMAESALAAREQAFGQAQEKAFKTLSERLLSEDNLKDFQFPDTKTIAALVDNFEVTDERLSRVQYIGTYNFRFRDDAVRQFFAEKNTPITDLRSRSILILPFYQAAEKTILWGESNPFLAAWSHTDSFQGLVPVQVPIGDIDDVADIGDSQVLSYDPAALQNMISRYRAGEAIILVARENAPGGLDITVYRTDRGSAEFIKTISLSDADKKDTETLFDAAARTVRNTFQSDWRARTAAAPGDETVSIQARVHFSSLRNWAETKASLDLVQGLSGVDVISLTPREARISISFTGGEERLRLALAQMDLSLSGPQIVDHNTGDIVYDLFLNRIEKEEAAP